MIELLPCPFCGGKARTWTISRYDVCVTCEKCMVRTPFTENVTFIDGNTSCIAAWNRRTPPPNADTTPAQGDGARHDTRDTRDTEE